MEKDDLFFTNVFIVIQRTESASLSAGEAKSELGREVLRFSANDNICKGGVGYVLCGVWHDSEKKLKVHRASEFSWLLSSILIVILVVVILFGIALLILFLRSLYHYSWLFRRRSIILLRRRAASTRQHEADDCPYHQLLDINHLHFRNLRKFYFQAGLREGEEKRASPDSVSNTNATPILYNDLRFYTI